MVSRIPAPRVAHPFDVERRAVLSGRLHRRHGELDAREACLAGDEPHGSRVLEKSPPTLNVGFVISHGVQALLGSLAAASNAPLPRPNLDPLPSVPPLMMRPPLFRIVASDLAVVTVVAAVASDVGAAEVSNEVHLAR